MLANFTWTRKRQFGNPNETENNSDTDNIFYVTWYVIKPIKYQTCFDINIKGKKPWTF